MFAIVSLPGHAPSRLSLPMRGRNMQEALRKVPDGGGGHEQLQLCRARDSTAGVQGSRRKSGTQDTAVCTLSPSLPKEPARCPSFAYTGRGLSPGCCTGLATNHGRV